VIPLVIYVQTTYTVLLINLQGHVLDTLQIINTEMPTQNMIVVLN